MVADGHPDSDFPVSQRPGLNRHKPSARLAPARSLPVPSFLTMEGGLLFSYLLSPQNPSKPYSPTARRLRHPDGLT
jgi:hypothetical protein